MRAQKTPETDAIEVPCISVRYVLADEYVAMTEHAQRLEIDLAQMTESRDTWYAVVHRDRLNKTYEDGILDAANACERRAESLLEGAAVARQCKADILSKIK